MNKFILIILILLSLIACSHYNNGSHARYVHKGYINYDIVNKIKNSDNSYTYFYIQVNTDSMLYDAYRRRLTRLGTACIYQDKWTVENSWFSELIRDTSINLVTSNHEATKLPNDSDLIHSYQLNSNNCIYNYGTVIFNNDSATVNINK